MRERYDALMAHPDQIEAILQEGAPRRVRPQRLSWPSCAKPSACAASPPLPHRRPPAARPKLALPVFKQYREADGRFYFKLADAQGRLLLQSQGLEQGKAAGQWVARLKQEGAAALADAPVQRDAAASEQDVLDALAALQAAEQA
jgi:tryptophanyl-tRNA synthetase